MQHTASMHKRVKFIIHKKRNERTGLSRYSETLLTYLDSSVDPFEIDFKLPLLLKKVFNHLNIDVESVLNHFPPYIHMDDSPNCVWHFTSQLQTIILNYHKPITCVVTVLDLIPVVSEYKEHSFFQQKLYNLSVRNIKSADAIIAISDWTKKELVKYFNINPDKIFVIPLAVDKEFKPYNIAKDTEEKRILYVGSERPRKNLGVLLEALSLIIRTDSKITLTKIGASQSLSARKSFIRTARHKKVHNNINMLNYVDDIVSEYNKADIFVFPSKYEGFGLPVLEAMACGCPVICSSATSLPEVGGESVLYFNPDKPEELAGAIERVLYDTALRNTLIQSGLKRSKDFSWDNVAQKTTEVYRTL